MTCDRDRIYALFENPAAADVETESHLGSCPECMELYGSVVEFAGALEDPEVWGGEVVFMPSTAGPGAGVDILVAESIRLEEERARGFDHVAALLDIAPDGWHSYLRRIDGVCTVGLVDALLDEARKRGSAPRDFERIADLAIEVSEALDPRSYPPGMVARARGNSWKDRANALRLRGEFQDALWALDEAERHYRQQPIPEFDLATADYVRATVLMETDRLSECLELTTRCATTFLDYGDLHRQIHAKMVEASANYNLGRKRESREILLALLKPLQEIDEARTLGLVFLNIAQTSVDLDDAEMASLYFLQAAPVFREFGMIEEEAKARWGLGRLLVSRGRLDEAVERLYAARAEIEKLGYSGDAALITLDLAEALLAQDRADAVRPLCQALVERFTKEGSSTRALRALSYLREAAEAGTASAELVRYVRKYVAEEPRQPQLLFLPPPS